MLKFTLRQNSKQTFKLTYFAQNSFYSLAEFMDVSNYTIEII